MLAACLTDSSEISGMIDLDGEEEFHAYSYVRLLPQLLIRLISKLTMHKEEPILSLMLQISR